MVLASVAAQPLPALALMARRNRSRPALLIALTFLLSFVGDMVGHYIGRRTGNSLWMSTVSDLITGPLLLWAIADWQVTYFERLMVRSSVVPFLLIYGALTIFVEDLSTLPKYSAPFLNLLILGASAWTLLRRALRENDRPLLRTDWFLILGGLALIVATSAVTTPIGAALLAQQRYDLMARVWELRALFGVVGMLLVMVGILVPATEAAAT
ncbi:MAG TPA: hypothetical protein VFI13_13060 [Gemmatimonadales bacterium]|nr:hypothetical protein [Gemmatimonadales bacterium]